MKTPDGKDTNVLSKTPEEIKKGLIEAIEEASWVTEAGDAHDLIDAVSKAHASIADALAYIQQLERERDEAINELRGYGCEQCAYSDLRNIDTICSNCELGSLWEWQGVKQHENR